MQERNETPELRSSTIRDPHRITFALTDLVRRVERAMAPFDRIIPENDAQKVGINAVRRGLQAPLPQIVENAGQSGSVIVAKLLEDKEQQSGFDAQGDRGGKLIRRRWRPEAFEYFYR